MSKPVQIDPANGIPDFPIRLDANFGIPNYEYHVTLAYSPPNTWAKEFIDWKNNAIPQAKFSKWIPAEWINPDLAQLRPLVAVPPIHADGEIADLWALKALRERYADRIREEESINAAAEIGELLGAAGVKLDDKLANGKTIAQHIAGLWVLARMDAGGLGFHQKALFNRARPWQVSPGLHPLCLPMHPAYPSNHSSQLHLFAWMIEEICRGTKKQRLAERFTDQCSGAARRREIAGVHFASDTVAGMALAHRILEKYLEDPEFKVVWIDPLRNAL